MPTREERCGVLERMGGNIARAAEPMRERGRYPSWYPSNGETGSTRLAWCYGDFGTTLAILSAAQATGESEWRSQALTMAKYAATRTYPEASVHDAGLCHGTAGAIQLFNRLWHATGDAVFADATRTWIDHTFAIRNDHAIAGFPAATRPRGQDPGWNADESLLSGATGVALALHATISEVEPSWDRLMLVDVATASPGA